MYNSEIVLKYFIYDNELKSYLDDNEAYKTVEQDLDLSEEKYRIEMLELFGVKDICDDKINKIIHSVFEKMKTDENMNEILKKMAKTFFSEDAELGLLVGFSYNYLYLLHPCICDLLKDGIIQHEHYATLKKAVEKNIN